MGVAGEIARLLEDLVSVALARTSSRDACRAAVVSPAFRIGANSDDVWPGFLPLDDLPPLAVGFGAEEPMGVACEIVRLPEELVSAALARTSPRDAYRAAVVSPAFRAATDSDDVWPSFLPPDGLPALAAGPRPALIQEGALPSPLHRPMVVSMEATAEVQGSELGGGVWPWCSNLHCLPISLSPIRPPGLVRMWR